MRLLLLTFVLLAALSAATGSNASRVYSFESAVDTEADEDSSVSEDRGLETSGQLKGVVESLIPSQKNTISKLFNNIKFDAIESNLLASSEFQKWSAAVAKAGKKNAAAAEALMVSTLTTRYGDETLTKMLVAAKQEPSLAASAEKLEAAQLRNWLASGQTADDVFKALKLKGANAVENPMLTTWMAYVTKLTENNAASRTKSREAAEVLMASTLSFHYGEEGLAQMIAAAKKMPRFADSANKLEATQLTNWMAKERTADEVFKLLKLDAAKENAINSPVFGAWMSYVMKLARENVSKHNAIDVLVKHNNELDLARKFAFIGESTRYSDVTKDLASGLQTTFFMHWKRTHFGLDEVVSAAAFKRGSPSYELVMENYAKFLNDYAEAYKKQIRGG